VYKIGDEENANLGAAFRDGGLKNLSIGPGVTEILPQAFDEAYGLESIVVRGRDNPADTASLTEGYYTRDGVLFRKYTNESGNVEYELCSYPKGKKVEGAYQIPAEVTKIGPGAFSGRTNLAGVEMNVNLRTIGDNAFEDCKSLTSVRISNIENTGNGVFKGCTSLTTVDIANDVTEIQDEMFMGCTALSAVDFKSVQTIGKSAFENTGLGEEITLPSSVSQLKDRAFAGCESLKKATLMNPNVVFGTDVFKDCAGTDDNGNNYPVLSSYRASTTQDYASANNHTFEALQTEGCHQIVVELENGSRDWISISVLDNNGNPVAGSDKVSSAEAEPGTRIRVNVKRLQDGPNLLLDHITVYELDSGSRDGGRVKNALMMIAASNNKTDGQPFTVEDVTFTFTMGSKDVDIVAVTAERIEKPIPDPPAGVPGGGEGTASVDEPASDETPSDAPETNTSEPPVTGNGSGSGGGTGSGGSGGTPSGSGSGTSGSEGTGSDGTGGGEPSDPGGSTETGGDLTGDFDSPLDHPENPAPEPERPATAMPGDDNTIEESDRNADTPCPGSSVL